MKTFEDYTAEARDLREQLRDILNTLDTLASNAQHLADVLSDVHGDLDEADTTALNLVTHVGVIKPKYRAKIGAKHFRLLAVLNEYGPMHRSHVARLVGLSEKSVDLYASTIRKNHLGDLVSKKGVYTLRAMGDGVSDSQDFKLV